MPNWCDNRVTIRAGKETREKIKEFLCGMQYYRPFSATGDTPLIGHETKFSFHNVVPQPDELLDQEDPRRKTNVPSRKDDGINGSMPEWYNWRVDNWGTKWDVSDVWMGESKVSLTYSFETAWSPPERVIRALSERFPNASITLSYHEPGCGYKGSITFKEGDVVRVTGDADVTV